MKIFETAANTVDGDNEEMLGDGPYQSTQLDAARFREKWLRHRALSHSYAADWQEQLAGEDQVLGKYPTSEAGNEVVEDKKDEEK